MLNFDVKRKINTLRDILVGKVPDPKAQVEQITIALIYKFMDDIDLEGAEWGKRTFFTEAYAKYAWTEIMTSENGAQQRADLYREGIEKMAANPHLPQLFRDIFRGAYIPYRDPETLNMFLKEINEFSYDNSEDLGNAFEYLLSIMGSQGDAGQFRTPRHIIDMMVKIIDPKKNESILDPACGTAGFLISAYKHIVEQNKNEDGNITLSADDRKLMTENFAGYDISPDMVRLARVNMYLHKFIKPQISEYDTLSSEEKWNDDYDVIFANPPFMTPKGGIIPHKRYRVQAKRAEVLFVDYIAEHLTLTGRAGIIVPEGIVFQSANAYKQLREYLVKDYLLYGVISLPAGVFNPYSGVKTSILLLDKVFAKKTDNIIFAKISNDGFDLGAQRRDVKGSEIDEVISLINDYKNGKDVSNNPLITIATKEKVKEQGYILVGDRYKDAVAVNSDYPMVRLKDICEINRDTINPIEDFGDKEFIYLDISSVENGTGKIEYSNFITGIDAPSRARRKVENGDIILSTVRPNLKAYGFVNTYRIDICVASTGFAVISQKSANQKFIYYTLFNDNIQNQLSSMMGKGAYPSVNQNDIQNLILPLPPLSVQEEIVAEIESYQKIIDGAKQVVKNYKPTIKIDPTWEMESLEELSNIKTGKIDVNKAVSNGKYPFFTCAKELYYIDEYAFDCEALLLAGNNATANYDVKHYKGKFNAYQRTYVITILENGKILYSYLKLIMDSKLVELKNNSIGSQTKYLTLGVIQRLQIPLPSLETQQKIVAEINEEMAIVEQNKRLIEIFEQKIKDKISGVWGE